MRSTYITCALPMADALRAAGALLLTATDKQRYTATRRREALARVMADSAVAAASSPPAPPRAAELVDSLVIAAVQLAKAQLAIDEAHHRAERELCFHLKDGATLRPRAEREQLDNALIAIRDVVLLALMKAGFALDMRADASADGLPRISAHEAPFFEALLHRNCDGGGCEDAAAASGPHPRTAAERADLLTRRAAYILTVDLGVRTLEAWSIAITFLDGNSDGTQPPELMTSQQEVWPAVLSVVLRVVAANARAQPPATAAASAWLAKRFEQWQEEVQKCVSLRDSCCTADIRAALAADGGAALAALRAAGAAYDAEVVRHLATLPPGPTKADVSRRCSSASCNKPEEHAGQFKTCGRCSSAWYCSAACQRAHWKAAHKRECTPPDTS